MEELKRAQDSGSAPKRQKVGLVRPVDLELTHGIWVEVEGGRLWMVELTSSDARMVRLHFKDVDLPSGVRLFVATPGGSGQVFSFEGRGPLRSGEFWTQELDGDTTRIEILVPESSAERRLELRLTNVGHIFANSLEPSEPGGCNLDASCYSDWSGPGKGVAKISFVDTPYVYVCSAVLLNNNSGDFSPLLLTARHCISTDPPTKTLNAYWGYRSKACGGSATDIAGVSTGIRLLASSAQSDASLIEVHSSTLEGVPYAGWSLASPAQGSDVVGIHNPGGSWQRISFGKIFPDAAEYPGFHRVIFSGGTVEPGSSGSPLFNMAGQVLGQLYGGNASCTNPGGDAGYGKMALSYPAFQGYLENGLPDDPYFGNQSLETAAVLTGPVDFKGLILKRNVDDWFRIVVPTNHKLSATGTGNAGLVITAYRETEGQPLAKFQERGYFFNDGPEATFYIRLRTPAPRMYYDLKVSSSAPVPPTLKQVTISNLGDFPESFGGYAYIEPNGFPFTAWIEWSQEPTFVNGLKSAPDFEDGSYIARPVYFQAFHIRPDTDYYLRLVGSGLTGLTYGPVLKHRTAKLREVTILFPKEGYVVGLANFVAYWDCNATSYDVYFGTTPDPPFLKTVTGRDFSVSQLTSDTKYYLRVVGKFEFGTSVSPTVSFNSWKYINFTWGAVPTAGPVAFAVPTVVGRSSDSVNVYLENKLAEALYVSGITTIGEYEPMGNCGGIIPAFASCTLPVRFKPLAEGARTGSLVVSHQYGTSVLPLTGIGIDFQILLSRPIRPARSGLSPGQQQDFAVAVSASGALNDIVELSCRSPIADTRCEVNPRRLAAHRGPATATVTVTIAPRSQRLRTRSTKTVVLKVHATLQGVTKTVDLPVQIER